MGARVKMNPQALTSEMLLLIEAQAGDAEIFTLPGDVVAKMAQMGPVEDSTVADLRFAGLEIEVKAALASRYDARGLPGFQFCLHRAGRNGVRADVVILLAIGSGVIVPFVMPAAVVGEHPKVTVPGLDPLTYNGQWAQWRGRWETLAEVLMDKLQPVG